MVMKVCNVNTPVFRGNKISIENSKNSKVSNPEVNELSVITPDYGVRIPVGYKKLGVKKLQNGLELHQYKLNNGYKVTIAPIEGSPAVVKNYVNVGSLNETSDIKGISHFLEHMAFNGTNGENGHVKLEVGDAFKKIDELGGWANASTNYAITDYINSSPLLKEGDLEAQLDVIAAMTEDLKLSDKMIAKEKGPVCSEINMILDNPQTIALDQTVRTVFGIKNSADELVGGSVKHIKDLTREDVKNYYDKYYTPDNMNLVVTGDVNPEEVIKLVSKKFNSRKLSKGKKFEEPLNPIQKTERKDFVSDKAVSTELVLGFSGAKNNDTFGKVLSDVLLEYINSQAYGMKSKLSKDNIYMFSDSEKIGTNPNSPQMIYLACKTSEQNSEKALRSIFSALQKRDITEDDLTRIKKTLIERRNNVTDYSAAMNDYIGKSVLDNDLEFLTDYEKVLDSITPEDVKSGFEKYLNTQKAAITLVHPAQNVGVSFKGKGREPINLSRISEYKLDNNFDVGFYETKNPQLKFRLLLNSDIPYSKKPGVDLLMSELYQMGTKNLSEDELDGFLEKNNLGLSVNFSNKALTISAKSSVENSGLIYEKIKELLYNPRFTQENLELAKEKIKDSIERIDRSASFIYDDYQSGKNPYDFTIQDILDNIDSITLDDLKECHEYVLKNSRGIVTANLPEGIDGETVKSDVIALVSGFDNVLENKKQVAKLYSDNDEVVVLTKENNNSQADIMQVHNFKLDGSLKEDASMRVLNSILTSSSIGLFDTLREKEHLAYSVYSSISRNMDKGELSCNILTTTDNKSINDINYANVQKSINGFNRQIGLLKNGDFTDKDLENAKLAIKASLLENEGTENKLDSIMRGMNSEYDITYLNQLYKEVDNLSKDDIVKTAEKVFSGKPIYSIVATKDTLNANKEFFDNLKLNI